MSRISPQRVLIVDDERNFRRFLGEALEAKGYAVEMAATARAGLGRARARSPDIVLLDQKLPDRSGLSILPELLRIPARPAVVMITAYAEYPCAIEAIKAGAFHYLSKPFEFADLLEVLDQAGTAVGRSAADIAEAGPLRAIVGEMPEVRRLKEQVARIAGSPVRTVLVQGESGTGKELVAQAVHALSDRAEQRMVALNCAALTETLLMSELFGHERGAFTSAHERKQGVFEAADGGTLFLDEIAEMSPQVQAAVLRALEHRTITRVGGTSEIQVDVRVVAATNCDLARKVRDGIFRKDLYHRINIVQLDLPPLRHRGRDILRLGRHFSEAVSTRYGEPTREVSEASAELLLRYPWPGNVRELRNTIERAYVVGEGPEITPADLPDKVREGEPPTSDELAPVPLDAPFQDAKQQVIDRFERRYLRTTLIEAGGNVTRAAESAGVLRQVFQRLLRRHGFRAADFRA